MSEVSKAYDNVFDALDMPYEAAASRLVDKALYGPGPAWLDENGYANIEQMVRDIADLLRQAVEVEQKRLRTILGFDVTKIEVEDGHQYQICYDPYWNLEGAVLDLERQKADKMCIGTIKKHQARLIAFDKATKIEAEQDSSPVRPSPQESNSEPE